MASQLLSDFRSVSVPVGQSVQLVGPNLRRVGLIIAAPAVNRIDLGFRADAVAGQGLALWPKTAPTQMVSEHWIHAIREGVTAIATGGPETVGVLDIFET